MRMLFPLIASASLLLGEPATIWLEEDFVVIETVNHTFLTPYLYHAESCKCGYGGWKGFLEEQVER